jgi:hypothetical protein
MDEERFITDDLSDVKTRDLLKALPSYFDFTGDVMASAYLSWRFDSKRDVEIKFYEIGKAYFDTSLSMIDICLGNNRDKKADTWIFPILFHIVHGIEVYLKGFNSQYRIFAKLEKQEYQESKIEGKHNIKQLCQVAKSLLNTNNDKDLYKEFLFVEKFIDILYDNTSDMTFARYPITDKKDNHFYVDQDVNIVIDLNILKAWVVRVFHILDNSTSFIDFQMDEMKEWLYEMQQEYGPVFWREC